MTTEEFWKSWLAFGIVAGPILLTYVGAAFSLYLSHQHMEAIKEALKNSRYIHIWGPSLGRRGVIWSLLEIAKIAGMVLLPWASLRIGELDPTDLKNFPPRLKRLLVINVTMMLISVIWMAVVSVVLKFR